VAAILRAGLQPLDAPVRAVAVLKPVEVSNGAAWARLEPARHLSIDFEIDFPDLAIGRQVRRLDMANGAFVRTLCDSRTFCRQADVVAMRAAGLGLGGSLANAVVVDGAQVLNPDGLRHRDEMVRHKMLDALGDLALAEATLLAAYTGYRAGHALTNTLLRALFADPDAYRMVEVDADTARRLPGAGVTPSDLPRVA
jgi:UDP-3-O-[3-hydroxymyristoyl] N-acetylglucosamine deacetylase